MTNLSFDGHRALGRAWRLAKALLGIERDAPVILMYHRVASPPFDPWGLCVSPQRFREQLSALKQHRILLSMDELVEALEAGDVQKKAAALTFDDGYADNAEVAKPMLEEMGIPATMFLTTASIGSGKLFWWDELAALILGGRDPVEIELELAGDRLFLRLPREETAPSELAQWRVGDRTSDPRRLAYVQLWRALQPMIAGDREAAMAELRRLLPAENALVRERPGLPMTADAVRSLPSLITKLGGHGRTHVPLPGLPPHDREREIAGGRREIAALAGVDPSGFAYPHGEWDSATRAMAIDAGYRWAVTTREAKVDRRHLDRFALPRLKAGDWSGAALLQAIRRATV